MKFSPLIQDLIDALRVLPGVGQKSAQRMAFHLLDRGRVGGSRLADVLATALREVGRCECCQTFSETPVCVICDDPRRQAGILCVVESPTDLVAIEQSGQFYGRYFVLMGHLSPMDGIGPEEIGVDKLCEQVAQQQITELVIATNPTVEGEATAYFIAEQVRRTGLTITRPAHGLPLGGELGNVDGGTLTHALSGRKPMLNS